MYNTTARGSHSLYDGLNSLFVFKGIDGCLQDQDSETCEAIYLKPIGRTRGVAWSGLQSLFPFVPSYARAGMCAGEMQHNLHIDSPCDLSFPLHYPGLFCLVSELTYFDALHHVSSLLLQGVRPMTEQSVHIQPEYYTGKEEQNTGNVTTC